MRLFRLRRDSAKHGPGPAELPILQFDGDPRTPISIFAVNNLSDNAKRRLYRALIAPSLLASRGIGPSSWTSADGEACVTLAADPGTHAVRLQARAPGGGDPFLRLEIGDNSINGFDLQLIALEDPDAERFGIDRDEDGRETHFGSVSRNLAEEARALRAGLSPGQMRAGGGGLRAALAQIETFMALLAHSAYSLEPLTYMSACLFERCGFAYSRGHRLMDEIHAQFQPGGALHAALDGSSPFRDPALANSVRGRAWAIHDGILAAINREWSGLRMVKQIGRDARVCTMPGLAI